jgi:hypothetical protein
MTSLTNTLDELLPGNYVEVTLDDGTTMEGPASPVDYLPDDRFRIEISPGTESIRRCEISARYVEGEWETPEVRHYSLGDDDWTVAGVVDDMRISR